MNKKEKQQQQQQPKKGSNKPAGEKGQKQQQSTRPPKAPKVDNSEDVKREQKLQAILLADSFATSFRPVTIDGPKVLLPLVNVPMLEYTLEFLSSNGVEEVFIFCVWHADKVQEYVNNSKWPSILSVRCIASASCLSAGDALRELDAMSVIRSDPFVLISGDVISNINLKEAIAFHKRKRKEDINNVMTLVLKEVQRTAGAKPLLDDLVVAMGRSSDQIVLFENNYKKGSVKVSLELMEDHPKGLNFYTDLLDCNVDICSPELMLQFSDNFDYQDIRKDFIRNEVGNWSLGKHIYGYRIKNEYAARVQDFRSYHSICRDIVTRWVYPLVPDAQLVPGSSYVHTQRYSYRESGVKVSRSAQIGAAVVLSRGAVVGEHVVLKRTIVGRDVVIGHNCKITESHIFKGAVIESNVTIDQSVICDNVVIGAGAVIPRGCVLSYGVVIGAGAVLKEYTRVSRHDGDDENDIQDLCEIESTKSLGNGSVGFVWTPREVVPDSDEEEEEEDEGVLGGAEAHDIDPLRMGSIGCTSDERWKRMLWSEMPRPEESDSDDEGEMGGDEDGEGNNQFSADVEATGAREVLSFARVVGEMVSTGISEGHPAGSLLMEIKGYKFAQNKSFADCLSGIVPALVGILATQSTDATTGAVKPAVFVTKLKETMKEGGWGLTLIESMIQDTREEIELINSLENVVLTPQYSSLYSIFRFILQIFYDGEVITEEAVLQWAALRESLEEDEAEEAAEGNAGSVQKVVVAGETVSIRGADRVKLFREPTVQALVEWIQEEDESGDEDDDEEGSEEESGEESD